MSSFLQRSNYFKKVATYNKLIAHDAIIEGGNRMSYHRINGEEELMAACVNWAHFPAMANIGNHLNFKQHGTGLPGRTISNHLYFLAVLDMETYPNKADAIEAAYDQAFTVMMECLAFMWEDKEEHGNCGEFFLFDLAKAKADMLDPINQVIYGWYLIFEDEKKAEELMWDATKFIKDVNNNII